MSFSARPSSPPPPSPSPSSPASSTRPSTPHALPLEIISKILELAFLPNHPQSPQLDPAPPRSTSHLLLVSQAIRQICLPFFWRSITIAQPQDWITLFDKEVGLVVAGEEGRQRWEWVEEVRIVVEARIPVKGKTVGTTLLHDVVFPSTRRIPRVLFHRSPPTSSTKLLSQLAKETENEQLLGRSIVALHQDFGNLEVSSYQKESSDRMASALHDDTWTEFKASLSAERALLFRNILHSFRPRRLHLPLVFWDGLLAHEEIQPLDFTSSVEELDPRLVLELDASGFEEWEPQCLPFELHSVVKGGVSVCLVGLSKLQEERMEEWILGEGKRNAEEERWDSTWEWRRVDGSRFSFDFAACWSK